MTPHQYGPHRDADAPTTVTIRTRAGEQTVTIPAALVEQRRVVNSIAHQQANRSEKDDRA